MPLAADAAYAAAARVPSHSGCAAPRRNLVPVSSWAAMRYARKRSCRPEGGKPDDDPRNREPSCSHHIRHWAVSRALPVVHSLVRNYNLMLRYWWNRTGIDPDKDIECVGSRHGHVSTAMADGQIDGFAPARVERGGGEKVSGERSVLFGQSGQNHPEKCLAVCGALGRRNARPARGDDGCICSSAEFCGYAENAD